MGRLRALLAGVLLSGAASGGFAADHREAPAVNLRPAADLNDVYLFRSPATPANAVFIMTVNPNSDPDFAKTYAFDPKVLYRFAIDTTGDGRPENKIDVLFGPLQNGVQSVEFRLNDGRKVAAGQTTPGSINPGVAPNIIQNGAIKAFAGPTDDPFFFDGVGFQRFLTGTGGFRGEDSFAGFNVSAIAIELPLAMISGGASKIQVAALTYVELPPEDPRFGARDITIANRSFEQFERTGVPAVSTAFIPLADRDEFNQTRPFQDADRWGSVIVATLQRLGTPPENIAILGAVALPDTLKIDFTKPSGFPNGRRLDDDVIDPILSLVLGTAVSDGVDANDAPFSTTFPYLGAPQLPN